MREATKTEKKLTGSVAAVILLAVCLCITTFALIYSTVSEDNNLFQTGEVKLNLNDGKPVIKEREFLFEPGMTVEKNFFLENQSSWDVYFRLYFDEIEGGLADVLEIRITDGGKTLYAGTAAELTRARVGAADSVLKLRERRELTVAFHYPEDVGNSGQALYLSFALKADAVQAKNNPDKLFD